MNWKPSWLHPQWGLDQSQWQRIRWDWQPLPAPTQCLWSQRQSGDSHNCFWTDFEKWKHLIVRERQLEVGEDEAVSGSTPVHLGFLNVFYFHEWIFVPPTVSMLTLTLRVALLILMLNGWGPCGTYLNFSQSLKRHNSVDDGQNYQFSPQSQIERWHKSRQCTLQCIGTCLMIIIMCGGDN